MRPRLCCLLLTLLLAGAANAQEASHGAPLTRIAFGSCAHQNKPQPIWDAVLAWRPELFIFTGDNVYGDVTSAAMTELREAYAKFDKLAILWSLGKDSNVVLWLTKKAFFGHVPLPVLHVDTGKKFKQMYDFRERYSQEWGLKLLIEPCPPVEEMDPTLPPAARSASE